MQQPVFSINSGYFNKYFDWLLRTVIFKTFYDLTIKLSINQSINQTKNLFGHVYMNE